MQSNHEDKDIEEYKKNNGNNDNVVNNHNDDNYSITSTSSPTGSMDSHDEALCEMLGLSSLNVLATTTFSTKHDQKQNNQDDLMIDIATGNNNDNKQLLLSFSNTTQQVQPSTIKKNNDDNDSESSVKYLNLPKSVSRYNLDNCVAFTIPNLFSSNECNALIQLGTTASFNYITQAMHTAPDGSTYPVPIQNPNPHKLSVFDHPSSVQLLWQRLKPVLEMEIMKRQRQQQDKEGGILSLSFSSNNIMTGLNPRLRVLKYDAQDNDKFDPHFDAKTTLGNKQVQTSKLTVLLYLNSGGGIDFDGGETLFLHHANCTQENQPQNYSSFSKQGIVEANDNINNNQHDDDDDDDNDKTNKKNDNIVVAITPTIGTVVIFDHDLFHSSCPLTMGTKYVLRTDVLFETTTTTNNNKDANDNTTKTAQNKKSNKNQQQSIQLVSDLCRNEFSKMHRAILQGMGLLDCSIESFCAPGRIQLRKMLKEEWISNDDDNDKSNSLELFLTRAFEIRNKNNATT